MTVRELEARLSAKELLEWIEFLTPADGKAGRPGNLLDLDPTAMAAMMTKGK